VIPVAKTSTAALCITAKRACRGPFRVIRVRVRPAAALAMSVMPRKRRSATKMRSVAMGHERTHALQHKCIQEDRLAVV